MIRQIVIAGALAGVALGAAACHSATDASAPVTPASPSPAAAHAAAAPKPKPSRAPQTVTYGPGGSTFNGTVPLSVTQPLPARPADCYSVMVQLSDAGGSVTCAVLVDGKAVSTSQASGADAICNAEAMQDPFTSQWQDANGS